MLRLGCLLLIIILIAIPAIASQYLTTWGTILVIVAEAAALLIGGPKLLSWGLKRAMLGLFMTKSRVLRNAGIHVHRVEATERSADPPRAEAAATESSEASSESEIEDDEQKDEDEDDDTLAPADHRFVLVDFTITPKPAQSKMSHWEPGELMLVPFDSKVDPEHDTDSKVSANADRIRLVEESGQETEDFDKIVGPAHLRAVFAIPPALSGRVKFRYYFEQFGDIVLP